MILDELQKYIGDEERQKLAEFVEYFTLKLKRVEKIVAGWKDDCDEETQCRQFLELEYKIRVNCIYRYALNHDWALCRKLLHYHDNAMDIINSIADFIGRQQYEARRQRFEDLAREGLAKNNLWGASNLYDSIHNVEFMRSEGVPYLFKEITQPYVNPGDVRHGLLAIFLLMSLEMNDMAWDYTKKLERYRKKDRSAKDYVEMDKCLMALLHAQTETDPETKKKFAAVAAVNAFASVMAHWNRKRTQDGLDIMSYEPNMAFIILVYFDFDAEWGDKCCKNMLYRLDFIKYHPFFIRAYNRNLWMEPWQNVSKLSPEQVFDIYSSIKAS